MSTQLRTMTADELLAMPDDGIRRELVGGELREMTPAGWKHGRIAGNIASDLGPYVRRHGVGAMATAEASFRLSADPDTVRAPDVSFVRQARLDAIGDTESFWPGAPDLAVEVISPSDRYSDVREKVDEYLAAGTEMVVVVDPRNREVTVFHASGERIELTEDGVLDGGDVVPGWRLPVRDIFA
jgi:Uma2 family endonuclease